MGLALTRNRDEVAQVLRDGGVLKAEIAGDLAVGDDVPGATPLFLVRTSTPLDWMELGQMRTSIEIALGCTAAVVDADAVGHWAAEAEGPRFPFDLGEPPPD